ncbi:GntR family transcriptional regulator [Acuticoccus kandeliae]|uniref:GntR family transcriptional regulator n=1 Tax=Acuticoccus kandeliae TaxID=2073160 RepID=UPI000D3E0C70|nr:GntR family transcriptional regulator [Acuticoccus kandeliae]
MNVGLRAEGGRASTGIYEDVRRRIIDMTLPPDTTLDRSDLAAQYDVSPGPIREAIRNLEQDGLVRSYPQSRTVVTRIDPARIAEEHFHRVAVECEVVRRLALRADPSALNTARGLLRTQEALVGDVTQIEMFRQQDDAFHESFFRDVGLIGLHRHIRSRSGQLARVRTLDLPSDGKMHAVFKAHMEILAAIDAGDPAAASDAMRRHLSGTIERIDTIRREHPHYFLGG